MTSYPPMAGLNLRQEDIPGYLAACAKAGIDPAELPILYTLHDDTLPQLDSCLAAAEQARLWVRVWRCFVSDSRLAPPRVPATDKNGQPCGIAGWNEADDQSAYPALPGWIDPWWQWVKSLGRGLLIHYGAPNVNGYLIENKPLEAALDVVDRHVGSTWAAMPDPPPAPDPDPDHGFDRQPFWHLPAATIGGRPSCVTEGEIDPSRYSITGGIYPWGPADQMATAYAELRDCAERTLALGIDFYAWGIQNGDESAGSPIAAPDAAYNPDFLRQLVELNAKYSQGVPPVTPTIDPTPAPAAPTFNDMAAAADLAARITTLEADVQQLQAQQKLTQEGTLRALYRELGDHFTGPSSAAADFDAIDGGQPVAEQAQAQGPAAGETANPQ